MSLLIRNGRLLNPAGGDDRHVDVRIKDGVIAEIAPATSLQAHSSPAGERSVDATGLWITPGLVDVHVHLREPGEEYKEDIASGSRAAAAGGFTTIVAMPNTKPAIDSAEMVAFVRDRGEKVGRCRVLPSAAITMGQEGKNLAPFGELRRVGAVAVTDDGRPVENAALMRSALEYANGFGLVVLTHAEDLCLSKAGHMHEGATSTRLGIAGVSRVAEDSIVARDIMLAEDVGARLHVCHVSTAGSVALIRDAKARGVKVTGEATPHHFSLTDVAVEGYDTFAKMNPPLREEHDRLAVIEGLKDGTLDCIATDHAPHSDVEKDVAFSDAANGVIGLQTSLPLSLDLWRHHGIPLMRVIDCLTRGGCRALGLPYGEVAVGKPADLAIIDPEAEWVFSPDQVLSKSSNSPFLHRTLKGRVAYTLLEGRITHPGNP